MKSNIYEKLMIFALKARQIERCTFDINRNILAAIALLKKKNRKMHSS